MPLRNLITIAVFAFGGLACYSKSPMNRDARELARAIQIISENHFKPVKPGELFDNAMSGMVSGLDRYSSYIPPKEFKEVEESLDQKFGGVGIIVEINPETKRLTVLSPLVGTPAYRAGLQSGDTILKIDTKSTEGLSLEQAVTYMRGNIGEPVDLEIARKTSADPLTVTVVRDLIPIESVLGDRRDSDGNWVFNAEQDPRIRYVRLTTFGKQSVTELQKVLEPKDGKLDYEALILDLRGNAGGLLSSAIQTCDLFIDGGPVVSTRGRDGRDREFYVAEKGTIIPTTVPIVVLTNNYSASASEIVAACLQDHARAVVVGERTWGKGTVQNIIDLDGGRSALKLTTATYWRPSGKNIHRANDAKEDDEWGVTPNKGFEIKIEDKELAEKIVKYRRYRDIVRNGQEDDETAVEPVEDPQFSAAVKLLSSKLDAGIQNEEPATNRTEANE